MVSSRASALIRELRSAGSSENLAGMARYGISVGDAYGVPLSAIRLLARRLGRDHSVALDLWDSGVREARVLAIFVADPARMSSSEMEHWARGIRSWDICDGCAVHLFRKSPLAWKKALAWSRRKPEFIRRLGFAMIATLAIHDKTAPDQRFLDVLPLIEHTAPDGRNFVKKAVNWALRQIGKRNPRLWKAAVVVSRRLAGSPDSAARWVGKDALRELLAKAGLGPAPLSVSKNRRRS